MNYLQLFLWQIPEAIYLALFIVFTKKLDKHRILFTVITVIEYLLLKYSFHIIGIFTLD